MTSIDMHGFSVTLLPASDELVEALTSPVGVPEWPGALAAVEPTTYAPRSSEEPELGAGERDRGVHAALAAAAQALLDARERLDELDAKVGDGDAGSTIGQGARAVREALEADRLSTGSPAVLAHRARLAGRAEHGRLERRRPLDPAHRDGRFPRRRRRPPGRARAGAGAHPRPRRRRGRRTDHGRRARPRGARAARPRRRGLGGAAGGGLHRERSPAPWSAAPAIYVPTSSTGCPTRVRRPSRWPWRPGPPRPASPSAVGAARVADSARDSAEARRHRHAHGDQGRAGRAGGDAAGGRRTPRARDGARRRRPRLALVRRGQAQGLRRDRYRVDPHRPVGHRDPGRGRGRDRPAQRGPGVHRVPGPAADGARRVRPALARRSRQGRRRSPPGEPRAAGAGRAWLAARARRSA